MSEFHPAIYCDNQNDWFLDNDRYNNTVSTKRSNNMLTPHEPKASQIIVKISEPKRRRTIEDIKKIDIIMRDFEKMLKKQK